MKNLRTYEQFTELMDNRFNPTLTREIEDKRQKVRELYSKYGVLYG